MNDSLTLLADIGGTNARFALADTQRTAPLLTDSVEQFEVSSFASLADAAAHYLRALDLSPGRVTSGTFAVAGRINGDEARITNHPWVISCQETRRALGLQQLRLVNDFSAGDDLAAIGSVAFRPSTAPSRTYAVLGPGTGLGVSALIIRDGRGMALETEGGHASFAPASALDAAVLDRLVHRFGRVSNERLVSGSGLVNIHQALCEIAGQAAPPLRPQDITAGAANGDVRCLETIDVFCAMFGAIAGDLVLMLGAWDGVFLSGGLVPKLLSQLQGSRFRERFEAKGPFAGALARVPSMAMMHDNPGLLGAAMIALQDRLPTVSLSAAR